MESSNLKPHLGFRGEWGIAGRKRGFSGSVVPHWTFCLLSNLKISCFRHDSFPHVCLQCGLGAQKLTDVLPLLSSLLEKHLSSPLFLRSSLFWASISAPPLHLSSVLFPSPNNAILTSSCWTSGSSSWCPFPGCWVNCVFQTGCSC